MLSGSPLEIALSRTNATAQRLLPHNRSRDIHPGVTVSRHRALLTGRQNARTHRQWANRPGSRSITRVHHRLNRLWVRNRRYFLPAQRLR